MQGRAIIAVWMNGSSGNEPEFHAWYETEHLAVVVAIGGMIGAQRFFNPDGDLPYLVFYHASDATVERGPGFQEMLRHPTPWTVRIRKLCQKPSRRTNLCVRYDSGKAGPAGALLALHSAGTSFAVAAEQCRDAIPGCQRYRALEDADRPGEWLEIYDFPNLAAAAAAQYSLSIARGTAVEIYHAIGTPVERAGARPTASGRTTARYAPRQPEIPAK